MSIEIEKIGKRFGETVALDEVSFVVPTGSLTALVGPSGGGKSTLLRVVAGLEDPDNGRISIEGEDVTHLPARERGIGFCFQHYAPFRHMNVFENVAFGLRVRKQPKDEIRRRVHELLELVRLEGYAERYPSQLSGGQRQRMALARALAVQPKVLLLDEPFGALDAQVRKELRAWLRQLHEEVHVTTVLVTHDQEEAMEVADQIAIIHHGILEQVGTPAQCYDEPESEFVLTFLGPATRLGGHWVRPHDLEVSATPLRDSRSGTLDRVVQLGFEVRLEVTLEDGSATWIQVSRRAFGDLDVGVGSTVYVRLVAAAPIAPVEGHAFEPSTL